MKEKDKINIDEFDGTATFHVDMDGNNHGERFRGNFKVKCVLNPIEYISADSTYRSLVGTANTGLASPHAADLAFSLSQLKYRIIKSPPFWGEEAGIPGGGVDDNVIIHVLNMAMKAEKDYRDIVKNRSKKAKEALRKAVDDGIITSSDEEGGDGFQKEREEVLGGNNEQIENDID